MAKIYFLLIAEYMVIRSFAGYESRYNKGKFFVLKNKIVRLLLVDKSSFHSRANRPKDDLNKISLAGVVNYAAFASVLLITAVVNLCLPIKYLPKPYGEEFFNISTVNELVAAVATLCFMSILFAEGAISVLTMLRNKEKFGKALRAFIAFCAVLMIAVSIGISATLISLLF